MTELETLEKEVVSLRALLAEKEARLHALKQKWTQEQCVASTINCAASVPQPPQSQRAHPPVHVGQTLPKWAIERYSRQILLQQIGVSGQEKLCASRALVVGAGGLGCPAAAYLAGAGVGVVGIVDYDTVDLTNLHRQILHSEENQGNSKVDSAKQAIQRLNSNVRVQIHRIQLNSSNALQVLGDYDVVLDCTDNVPTRYLLNDACILLKIPLISGSALKMEGQLTIYGYRYTKPTDKQPQAGPCYRCLFPTPPPPETVGSCSAQGVLGPVPGVIGSLQALEAIKLLSGRPRKELLVSRMLLMDGEDCSFTSVKLRGKSAECAVCSDNANVTQLLDYEEFCQARAKEKKKEDARLKSLRRKEEKEKRMSGQSYYGFRKSFGETKEKWVQDVPKGERKMGPACDSDYCAKGIARSCADFTEDQRREIFMRFWNEMDWKAKKAYVKSMVETTPPRRRRAKHKGEVSRKGDSKVYHLMKGDLRVAVCRKMFLNTLAIKEATIRCWLVSEKPKVPKRKPLKALKVHGYLDSLNKFYPKCEQCRNFTTRLYVDPGIRNQQQLYKKYVADMSERGISPVSRKTFAKVFAAKNLGIFRPKSEGDVCDLFAQHNAKPDTQVGGQSHVDVGQTNREIVQHKVDNFALANVFMLDIETRT